jgi:DNA-binding winged helix-turn-helix (wHTH) protein/TolB-like protein
VLTRVRFGLFEFDAASGALVKEGIAQRLQPQPARVLAVLLERPGEVVTRDVLQQRIWSEGTFVDFERGLNFCVAQIRNALGDSAESPRFIETIPKRGYRFIAPVAAVQAPAAAPEADPAAASASAVDPPLPAASMPASSGLRALPRHYAFLWIVLGIAAATVAAAGAAWRAGSSERPIRVAVVPFDNETGKNSMDNVAVGVADATVARLAAPERARRLRVIGNSAALRHPRRFRDLKVIGQQVRAEYVVLAQMKADASQVRLIAHLIRTADEAHVWANTFDRPAFTLDVQSEIAEAIASAVTARLTGE